MSKIFVIGDTHFGHKNIIEYCARPFTSVKAMDEGMIWAWNKVVSPEDIVYHLGDFALCDKGRIRQILGQLNGHKYLILGNHDHASKEWYLKNGFEKVYDKPVLLQKMHIVLSHKPIPDDDLEATGVVNIHGHTHDQPADPKEFYPQWHLNASAEVVGYRPVEIGRRRSEQTA